MTAEDLAERLAVVVRRRQAAAGLSTRGLARAAGISTPTLWQLGGTPARPARAPTLAVVLRLASALGTTPAVLLAEAEAEDDLE